MRKIIALLLAAAMGLSLTACGRSETPDNETQADEKQTVISQIKENIAATKDCAAIIRMQINPAFDLYLDENHQVLAIDCLNEDARQMLAETDLVGQNGMDAIYWLVSTVFIRGLVKEDVVVYITPVYGEENSSVRELVKDIPAVISEMKDDLQLSFAVSAAFDEDGVVEESGSGNASGNDSADPDTSVPDQQEVPVSGNETEVVKDEAGNIIKTVQVDGAGNIQTHYYDVNGSLTKEIMELANGVRQETEFDQSGTPIKIITDYADGNHIESTLVNGKVTKTIQRDVHGTVMETTLDGNGTPILTTGTTADGAAMERTYYPNGEVKEATERYADGAYNKQTFDENGIKLSYEGAYVRNDGVLTGFKFLYDANGNETEYWGQDNFGRPVHSVYNADGSHVTETTESDGSITLSYYDANGNKIHS